MIYKWVYHLYQSVNITTLPLSLSLFIIYRMSSPHKLTKFERIRVIGQRAEQISSGAPIRINRDHYPHLVDAIGIAEEEFEEMVIPFLINRTFPDGTIRTYKISELV